MKNALVIRDELGELLVNCKELFLICCLIKRVSKSLSLSLSFSLSLCICSVSVQRMHTSLSLSLHQLSFCSARGREEQSLIQLNTDISCLFL